MDDTTLAVQALYAEAGYELAEDFRELPDHVAAELELLYLLIFRENEARRDWREKGSACQPQRSIFRGTFPPQHLEAPGSASSRRRSRWARSPISIASWLT